MAALGQALAEAIISLRTPGTTAIDLVRLGLSDKLVHHRWMMRKIID